VGVGVSRIKVTGLTADTTLPLDSQDWLLEISADRKWDWTDDLLYPTRGGYLTLGATWAPAAAFFGASYVKAQTDVAGYLPLGALADAEAHVTVGWARPLGTNDELLANRRFYAGGYNTMRGYRRHRLGPRDAEGNPRGGEAELLAGVELRRHLFWILDAAAFLDNGNVWATPSDMGLVDLLSAWGLDLDVRTPLGPLRVGYAWNLGPVVPGEPRSLWHFGIGYPW
jgi:outer membrane protein assembly factor BamA